MQTSRAIIAQARLLWLSTWSPKHEKLSPAEFQARFDALYAVTKHPTALWQLGGAANDFLRKNPGSISVPSELAPLLLQSKRVDGRIIVLKLFTRTSSDVVAMSAAICRALASRTSHEQCGGLHELGVLLDRITGRVDCGHSRLPPSCKLPKHALLERLAKIESSSSSADYNRESAKRLREWLWEL